VSGAVPAFAASTWVAIAVVLGGFLALFAGLQVVARLAAVSGEATRKMFHAGSGALTLTFPFLFRDAWPVLLLTGAAAALVAAVKFLPALRDRYGGVTNRVERPTLGELYFPVAVALLFWLTRGEHPLLFVVPVLMLTFADATCAVVGSRYGLTRYEGASKSLEGSVAFAVVAFLCVHVPLLLWGNVGRAESLLIGATLALLVMLLEGSAWRGLDNLFIPLGGYFLLRAYLPLDAAALAPRLAVTVALVLLIITARRRMTLEDDSLVAAAFLCYVAWAVMGWRWLIGPLAIALGYRWLSPPTADNSRRMHGMAAVLAVWAPAIGWLALARAAAGPAMLFPYSIAFAAHLAMFGISRLGYQFPDRPLGRLAARALATSAAIVMVPFVAFSGTEVAPIAVVLAGTAGIAIGIAAFVATQADIRRTPQTGWRWVCQAAAASLASAVAWGLAAGAARALERMHGP
jgi:phytol kinase